MTDTGELSLLVRAGSQLVAEPLAHIEETMRPQPLRALAGVPPFILGLAVIRGVPAPVIDAAQVLGQTQTHSNRFVTLKVADRRVVLAVDEVLGVRHIDGARVPDLPPLLAQVGEEVIAAIGVLDSELLVVLRSGKLVPENVWQTIDAEGIR